jgi:sugar phosphate isomerase/epimerase
VETLKKRYPFRLGTTSFIYPADYVTNVRQLAPYLDEIELLLLESTHLPSHNEIEELQHLGADHDITYNVHLPMDIDPASDQPDRRQASIASIANAIDRVAPLTPTTLTLHLTFSETEKRDTDVNGWQMRAVESMRQLLKTTGITADLISIETLDYPPFWLEPVVQMLGVSVCVDVGHVILHGFDLAQVLESFAAQTTMMHLHGVASGTDHRPVHHIKPDDRYTVSRFLQNFKGSVSIEVFNLKHLHESWIDFPDLMAVGSQDATWKQKTFNTDPGGP